MRKLYFLFSFFFSFFLFSQEETSVRGNVFSIKTQLPMENVNIVNLNEVKGTITNFKGDFTIRASVNDTLHFSFIGHKSMKVRVTADMIKYGGTRIGMSELAYALEEVVVTPYKLTGYLEIDAKYIPVNTNGQYQIAGANKGYEAMRGNYGTGGVGIGIGKALKSLNSRQKDIKKLKKIKQDEALKNLLHSKFDREMISEILGISVTEIAEILRDCNYSEEFITNANDVQILEAITQCTDELNVIKNK